MLNQGEKMMFRRILLTGLLLVIVSLSCFGQTAVLRDYVGMISQTFHPDIVSYLEKFSSNLDKQGYNAAAKSIDNYIKGYSGTGFVYVAADGRNYIITNYHVISQAQTLTITFEKQDGEKTKFAGLTIVAADEDMDIALLSFAGGHNPFKQGLSFLDRAVQEGDDVYSAGFPGFGSSMIWQFGRGMVSNAAVRLPAGDDTDKTLGPFIQHTAEVDPGNSGGPLLIQTQGVPSGYAVAGINTLKARNRQAANYSIPVNRIRSFLDASLKSAPADQRPLLDARTAAFIEGLKAAKAVFPHIAAYLSNDCAGENAEYAFSEIFEKASKTVVNDIATAFVYSPVEGMTYAVAWIIENALRSKSGRIVVEVDSVSPNESGGFTVGFKVNDKIITSEWINEYGIWRIRSFGNFASGDKSLIKKRAEKKEADARLRSNPNVQIGAAFAYLFNRGPALDLDFIFLSAPFGYGLQGVITKGFLQVEVFSGLYFPIKLGSTAALTPFVDVGFGFQSKDYTGDDGIRFPDFGLSFEAGMQFTTAAVPGLYLFTSYQYNMYFISSLFSAATETDLDAHVILAGLGYSF
jgi:serine protease Do